MCHYPRGLGLRNALIPLTLFLFRLPALLVVPVCFGASNIYVWDGGADDNNWTSGANWSTDVAPPNDGTAELRFSGVTRTAPFANGSSPWSIRRILFAWNASGQFILSGGPLSVAERISSQDQGAPSQAINNKITFISATPTISAGYGKTLTFGGAVSSASPLLLLGSGPSTIQIATGGAVDASALEISAANAAYGDVTLRLDHSAALANRTVLKLTPKSDGTKQARVKLNFSASQAQSVSGLVINGIAQPAGIYNAASHPGYFTGTGNLQVGTGGSTTVPITSWAEWGPSWGRAGLSVPRYNAEGMMAPQPGDIDNNSGGLGRGMIEWRDVRTSADGSLNFLSVEAFPRIAQSRPQDGYEWAGMVEYLHTYMKASDTAFTSAVLNVRSSPNPVQMWLNGKWVASGQTIVLKPGWNRLMVKSRSPRSPDGQTWTSWSFAAALTKATNSVQFRTTDPERIVLVTSDNRSFRYLSTYMRTDGDPPVFALGSAGAMDITLAYRLQVGIGVSSNYQSPSDRTMLFVGYPWVYAFDPARVAASQPNPGQAWMTVPAANWTGFAPSKVRLLVRDDRGWSILDRTYALSYGTPSNDVIIASRQISLRGLKVGNYAVSSDLLDSTGAVLARDNSHSFAVVPGPVDRSQDQKPRSLGVVGHWLLGASSIDPSGMRYPSRLRWLNRIGITRQHKLWEAWDVWGPIRFDSGGDVAIGPASRVDNALTLAKGLNIDICGDLVEGYYQSAIDNLTPSGSDQTLPPYGSAAWNNIFFNYGFELASKYSAQIQTWGGINEIDGHSANTDAAATKYIEAARQIKAGMEAANPRAKYIGSSLIRSSSAQTLFAAGFLTVPDIVDVHSHPWRAPEPWEVSLTPYSSGEGRTMLINNGYTGPLIYGEMSAPRGHNPRGAHGQAEDMVKQLAWAINWRDVSSAPVKAIDYLVAYDGPDYWSYNLGFNNQYGDPLPVVNAANVASRLLDGRNLLPAVSGLPSGVSHIRVTNSDTQYPETVVVWNTKGTTNISLSVTGKSIKLVDIMGREQTYAITGNQFSLSIDTTPRYIRGAFQ